MSKLKADIIIHPTETLPVVRRKTPMLIMKPDDITLMSLGFCCFKSVMFFGFGFVLVTLNTWTLQNTAATFG